MPVSSSSRNCPNLSFLDVGHCRDLRVFCMFAFGCWKNMMLTQVDPGPNTLSLFIYEIIIKPNTHKLQTSRYINWKPGITFQPKNPIQKKMDGCTTFGSAKKRGIRFSPRLSTGGAEVGTSHFGDGANGAKR